MSIPSVSGSGSASALPFKSGPASPAANSSACLFASGQSRCFSDRLSLRPFSRHSSWNRRFSGRETPGPGSGPTRRRRSSGRRAGPLLPPTPPEALTGRFRGCRTSRPTNRASMPFSRAPFAATAFRRKLRRHGADGIRRRIFATGRKNPYKRHQGKAGPLRRTEPLRAPSPTSRPATPDPDPAQSGPPPLPGRAPRPWRRPPRRPPAKASPSSCPPCSQGPRGPRVTGRRRHRREAT